jgi:hypothetical protein
VFLLVTFFEPGRWSEALEALLRCCSRFAIKPIISPAVELLFSIFLIKNLFSPVKLDCKTFGRRELFHDNAGLESRACLTFADPARSQTPGTPPLVPRMTGAKSFTVGLTQLCRTSQRKEDFVVHTKFEFVTLMTACVIVLELLKPLQI